MKKKFTLIVAIGSIIAVMVLNSRLNTQKINTYALLSNVEALTLELSDEEKAILLQGSLAVIPIEPLRTTKYSSYIDVRYLANLNNITIQIVCASGTTAYSTNVNPVMGGQLSVSLAGLSIGIYTIVFMASNESSIYDDFEI
jgi:hypothetical protein